MENSGDKLLTRCFKHMSVFLQEAVAIQLEEERLVKIRDVLKELPTPHYRYSPPLHTECFCCRCIHVVFPIDFIKPLNVIQWISLKQFCSIILIQDRLLSSHRRLRKQSGHSYSSCPLHSSERLPKISQFPPPTHQEFCAIQHFIADTLRTFRDTRPAGTIRLL